MDRIKQLEWYFLYFLAYVKIVVLLSIISSNRIKVKSGMFVCFKYFSYLQLQRVAASCSLCFKMSAERFTSCAKWPVNEGHWHRCVCEMARDVITLEKCSAMGQMLSSALAIRLILAVGLPHIITVRHLQAIWIITHIRMVLNTHRFLSVSFVGLSRLVSFSFKCRDLNHPGFMDF